MNAVARLWATARAHVSRFVRSAGTYVAAVLEDVLERLHAACRAIVAVVVPIVQQTAHTVRVFVAGMQQRARTTVRHVRDHVEVPECLPSLAVATIVVLLLAGCSNIMGMPSAWEGALALVLRTLHVALISAVIVIWLDQTEIRRLHTAFPPGFGAECFPGGGGPTGGHAAATGFALDLRPSAPGPVPLTGLGPAFTELNLAAVPGRVEPRDEIDVSRSSNRRKRGRAAGRTAS